MSLPEFFTFKIGFDASLLPRRFTWLRHHRGWLSVRTPSENELADANAVAIGERDASLGLEQIDRWLLPVIEQATPGELEQIKRAQVRELLDWKASAFEVFGIDVTFDRFLEDEAGPLQSGGEFGCADIDLDVDTHGNKASAGEKGNQADE